MDTLPKEVIAATIDQWKSPYMYHIERTNDDNLDSFTAILSQPTPHQPVSAFTMKYAVYCRFTLTDRTHTITADP